MSPRQILEESSCLLWRTHVLIHRVASPYSNWWEMPLISLLSHQAANNLNCSGWRDCLKLLVWEKVKKAVRPAV